VFVPLFDLQSLENWVGGEGGARFEIVQGKRAGEKIVRVSWDKLQVIKKNFSYDIICCSSSQQFLKKPSIRRE